MQHPDPSQETGLHALLGVPYTRAVTHVTSEYQPEDLLALLRTVLVPGETGFVPIPVRTWGDDLKRQGITRGGGVALRKRLRKLDSAKVIDLHPVRGHFTLVKWHSTEMAPLRPRTWDELLAMSAQALGNILRLAAQHPEVYARPGILAAQLVYQMESARGATLRCPQSN
jgi:hypothetical protein